MNYGLAYKQAHEMQQVLYQIVMDDKATPSVKASCARVWSLLQESRRIIRNKPLPGQLRPDLEQKRKARRPSSLLPLPEVDATAAPIQPLPSEPLKAPEQAGEPQGEGAVFASPTVEARVSSCDVTPPTVTPSAPIVACSPCGGTGIIRYKGGYNVECKTCGGTGHRSEPSACDLP